MLGSRTAKGVFHALALALPEEGMNMISAVKLRYGWGGVIDVRVHTPLSSRQREELVPVQMAMEEALDGQRHRVEIIWESLG